MGDDCRDCPYQEAGKENMAQLRGDMNGLGVRVNQLERQMSAQERDTETLYNLMSEIKEAVSRIEIAVYQREDPFEKIVYDFGLFIAKAGITGGVIVCRQQRGYGRAFLAAFCMGQKAPDRSLLEVRRQGSGTESHGCRRCRICALTQEISRPAKRVRLD